MWNERELIDFLRRRRLRSAGHAVRAGIGDDAAVLALSAGEELLVTTDLFVEGVHFRREWITAAAAGRRAVSRALSDIAAMGGQPRWAFLSLAAPADGDARWLKSFLAGFETAARRFGLALAGGDTGSSGSDVFLADVVICGSAPRGRALLRSGARPGDVLFVSGKLGAAAAALHAGKPLPVIRPRLALGAWLSGRRLASAMIDLTDGLSTDAAHLAHESGAGLEIDAQRVPLAGTLDQALHGGEDYELLFTVPPRKARRLPTRVQGVSLTAIGRVIEQGVWLAERGDRRPLPAGGWEHRGGDGFGRR